MNVPALMSASDAFATPAIFQASPSIREAVFPSRVLIVTFGPVTDVTVPPK